VTTTPLVAASPHALRQTEGERQVDGERTDIAKLVDHEVDAVQRIMEALAQAVAIHACRGVAASRIAARRDSAAGGDQDDSAHVRWLKPQALNWSDLYQV
jgi:hypothetical protein